MTYTAARGDGRSLTHRARPGIKPTSSWILVGFVSTEAQWELLLRGFLIQVSQCPVGVGLGGEDGRLNVHHPLASLSSSPVSHSLLLPLTLLLDLIALW